MTCLENNLHTVSYYFTWTYLNTCFSCDFQMLLPSNLCNLEKVLTFAIIFADWKICDLFAFSLQCLFVFRKHLFKIFMNEPHSTYMSVCVGRWILWKQLHVALKLQKVRKDIEKDIVGNKNFWMKGFETPVFFQMVKPS